VPMTRTKALFGIFATFLLVLGGALAYPLVKREHVAFRVYERTFLTFVDILNSAPYTDRHRPLNDRSALRMRDSDPLGQQPRPPKSIPTAAKAPVYSGNLRDLKQQHKRLIRKIQLVLALEGYYAGPVHGVLDVKTKKAIAKYKKDAIILTPDLIDVYTLDSLGIKGF
jgi:hypothetical protein